MLYQMQWKRGKTYKGKALNKCSNWIQLQGFNNSESIR